MELSTSQITRKGPAYALQNGHESIKLDLLKKYPYRNGHFYSFLVGTYVDVGLGEGKMAVSAKILNSYHLA